MLTRPVLFLTGVLTATALPLAAAAPTWGAREESPRIFRELATFAVDGHVAEILAVTPNGRTLLYTDSTQGELGLVDLTEPHEPTQLATLKVDGEPTSVAVTQGGRYALVAVDTSTSFAEPSGFLVVVDLGTHQVVEALDLGGQPDSVTVSPNGAVAAIAVENERDEAAVVQGVEGALPQEPGGFLAVVDLLGRPSSWTVETVELIGLQGARYPSDPEPGFVDINREGLAAVTLEENNAVAIVDLRERDVVGSFSTGTVARTDADTADDDVIAFDDSLTAPREPDAVQWTPDGNLLTADEGDLEPTPSGGRGWTIFSPSGDIVFASGGSAERALAAAGRYPDDRSDAKGAEFEGAEVASLLGGSYAFIGSERGDAVLAYRIEDESAPRLVQVLGTGASPEGLLAVSGHQLFLTSNEDDGTISVFQLRASRR
ncbi:MAG: hypothetical protein M3393_08970 [Actinomycetota bacterium]|nr:hypothetical protein [Actinomycetota bacterium]